MHIDFITRGHKRAVDEFITDLNHQRLPYQHTFTKDGHLENGLLQVRVCPIQLWDVSFPEPQRDVMLTTLFGNGTGDGEGHPINPSKKMDLALAGMRKIMGLKKIPSEWKTDLALPPVLKHTEILAIGEKEDKFNERGIEQI